jgi:hypothetical protein
MRAVPADLSVGTTPVLDRKLWLAGTNLSGVLSWWIFDPFTASWTNRPTTDTDVRDAAAIKVFLNGQPRIEAVSGSRPGNNLQYIP